MSRFDIHLANVVAWCEQYDGELHHACITDPPYHLTNRTMDAKTCVACGRVLPGPDSSRVVCPRCGGELIYQRSQGGRGFMGKEWDGGDIAFRPETWAAIMRVLHPGAFVMAFASARGWHRMAVAMEDAGLIIHPSIFGFGWCYGSGFPKATRIAKTDLAAAWQGHRYGLQALKPALEPIIVAQVPYRGRPVDSITRTGAGALWVDGARLPTADDLNGGSYGNTSRDDDAFFARKRPGGAGDFVQPSGRWPANFYLSHHPACADTCHPDCPVERIGRQSGMSASKASQRGAVNLGTFGGTLQAPDQPWVDNGRTRGHSDSGTAARFFFNADYALDRLEDADPALYAAKASKAEREAGLLPAQRARMAELYGDDEADEFEATTVDDGRQTPIDNPYQRGETERYNTHPTIKPLAVARWLATLLLPPDLYAPRRLFVPFSGAGSEMIGALMAGWEYVQGVELMEDHVAIAHARAEWWINRPEMEREALRTAMTRPISGKGTAELTPLERMIADLEP